MRSGAEAENDVDLAGTLIKLFQCCRPACQPASPPARSFFPFCFSRGPASSICFISTHCRSQSEDHSSSTTPPVPGPGVSPGSCSSCTTRRQGSSTRPAAPDVALKAPVVPPACPKPPARSASTLPPSGNPHSASRPHPRSRASTQPRIHASTHPRILLDVQRAEGHCIQDHSCAGLAWP